MKNYLGLMIVTGFFDRNSSGKHWTPSSTPSNLLVYSGDDRLESQLGYY
jgi:hypothetical protein